ncbi:MAG: fliJ [Hyphomicrobiales bacterium]|jgi:flagellar export protein FliJ|nr:fliJ [Hyphomicrobiales bacterium]
MKSRDSLIRLKRFQAEEKRRRVSQIEGMVAEFSRMATDLDREIAAEEQRSGIADPAHFAYSTYARAARGRRDNLHQSAGELRQQLEEARSSYQDSLEEVTRAQNLEGREKASDRMSDLGRDIESIGLRPQGA